MRSGAAAGHTGYFHETAFYESDEAFLHMLVPFFQDGLAAGEPTVSAFAPRNQDLLRDALGDDCGIHFLNGAAQYQRPAVAIRQYRDMLAGYVAGGATQIRVAGDVPHPGLGVPWEWWARYEAAINHTYDDFPIWSICPYDTRITPDAVLDDVRRSHPFIATGTDHAANGAFEDPIEFLRQRTPGWSDPLESVPAAVDLVNPTPAQARAAVTRIAVVSPGVSDQDIDGLTLAVSEAVTNAVIHSRPPVRMRVWASSHRIVVTVTDPGTGPSDPLAGLMPALRPGPGGLGLWLAHQACSYVTLSHDATGFTLRLAAGDQPDLSITRSA